MLNGNIGLGSIWFKQFLAFCLWEGFKYFLGNFLYWVQKRDYEILDEPLTIEHTE